MRNLKLKELILQYTPYVFFSSFCLYWFFDNLIGNQTINYLSVGFIFLMLFQILKQQKILGFSLGIFFMIVSIIIGLGILSDHNDTLEMRQHVNKFLNIGCIVSISCFLMALQMTIVNYRKLTKSSVGS
jgi:hypothetical protein